MRRRHHNGVTVATNLLCSLVSRVPPPSPRLATAPRNPPPRRRPLSAVRRPRPHKSTSAGMELFPDQAHVRLRRRMRGTFLYADEDGRGGWRPPWPPPLRRLQTVPGGFARPGAAWPQRLPAPLRGAAAGRRRLGGRGMGNWGSRPRPPILRLNGKYTASGTTASSSTTSSTRARWCTGRSRPSSPTETSAARPSTPNSGEHAVSSRPFNSSLSKLGGAGFLSWAE